ARNLLWQDGLLPPPVTDGAAYTVFAAVFLDLTLFEPAMRSFLFPAIECPASIEAVLAQDLDGMVLLATTKPAGAPEPSSQAAEADGVEPPTGKTEVDEPATKQGRVRFRFEWLARRAMSATQRGNSARAAILWTRLADQAG